MKIESSFLISGEDTKLLPFDKVQNGSFNFVEFEDTDDVTNDQTTLFKQKSNSCAVSITTVEPGTIKSLKLTNQSILTWDDLWLDTEIDVSIDPHIESINLQRNSLLYVNFNLKRESLRHINLEGNIYLKSFTGTNLPALESLNFEDCFNLEVINLGLSKNIRSLSLKNCRLTEEGLERTLSSFIPTKTASANIFPGTLPLFRKRYETLLDLRGNDINWGNKRIASKIRLLVTNNWLVLWDNPPPTSIIPIQMYAFFPRNLSDASIENYYGRSLMQPGSMGISPISRDSSTPPPPEPEGTVPEPTTPGPAQSQAPTLASAPQPQQTQQQQQQSSPTPSYSSPTPTPTPTPSPAPTPTPTPTPTPSPAPTPTPSPSPPSYYY